MPDSARQKLHSSVSPSSWRNIISNMTELSRTHNVLSSQHAETIASHSSTSHASRIVELDTQKFRIAKTTSELEIEGEKLEAELAGLKARLQELEMQGVEGGDVSSAGRAAENEVVLKLKIYRMFGIDAQPDEAGNFGKAVIRNASKGDVHVVDINPKFSRYYYANYFWNTM